MTFTIHASKDGQSVTTVRLGSTVTVTKARALLANGWEVHITDARGRQLQSGDWDELVTVDPEPK